MIPLVSLERQLNIQTTLGPDTSGAVNVSPLTNGCEVEALEFLAAEPLHNVYMAGFIRDNGLVSPLNRGTFYACRDESGHLEGIALIGHVTQFDARTSRALKAFAHKAQGGSSVHVLMGEHAKVRNFWRNYASGGQELRVACRELLLEQRLPIQAEGNAPQLRPAVAHDLPLILRVQAAMAVAECGVNPLATDPDGFSDRCAKRIERGRIWVLVEKGKLIFKADIMAETPGTIYLEGVYVNRQQRQLGHGRRCLLRLGQILLTRSNSICLLVNERNKVAQNFYYGVGYNLRGLYDTIYLYEGRQPPDD